MVYVSCGEVDRLTYLPNPAFFAVSSVSSLNLIPTFIHSKNTTASVVDIPNISANFGADTPSFAPVSANMFAIFSAFSGVDKPYFVLILSNSFL